MTISLTPETEARIAARLASSRYQSADELLRAALALLDEQERAEASPVVPTEAPLTDLQSAQFASRAYQAWLSSEDDIYDELFTDDLAAG